MSEFDTVDALRDDIAHAPRPLRAGAGAARGAREGARRRRRARARSTSPTRSSTRRWSAASTTSRTASRSRGPGHHDPAVPRGHRSGPGGVRRRRCARPRPEAVRSDLALRAVIAQEAIEATDDEVDAEIDRLAERTGEKPAKIRKDLERRGARSRRYARISPEARRSPSSSSTRRSSTRTATRRPLPTRSPPRPAEAAEPAEPAKPVRRAGSARSTRRGVRAVSEPIRNAFYIPYVTEQTAPWPETRNDVFDRLLQGPHHLPRHADRRRRRQHRDRAAAAPRERGPRQGHLDLHQLARRRDHRALRDLRHDAVHQVRGVAPSASGRPPRPPR